jgi:UDP-N-acetylmuramoyl-tripeptide--D-alanyl-D-alanine ligase
MTFDLADVARACGSAVEPPAARVTGWSVDTRSLGPGDLFFALKGPNHDGHDHLYAAFQRGAVAAVVCGAGSPAGRAGHLAGDPFLIPVPDVQAALEQLACWARAHWPGTMVALTGSAGKTTTKEVAAALLSVEMPAGKTHGNLNNHIGVPLSILRLPEETRAAVLEIGMNHPGEIRHLAAIAKPCVGVITNVGFAHAEFFNSADDVALAKRELIESLPPDGTAVLNADDARVVRFRDFHPGPTVTFAIDQPADVRPERVEYSSEGVRFRLEGVDFESSFVGRHGLMNILAGLAVARVFSIAPKRLRDAVRELRPARMRGERFTHNGVLVLNDCYNSNPEAVRAMLDVLRVMPARRRIAVLGEMLELGRWSEPLHRDVGAYAAAQEVDVLIGIRGAARQMIDQAVRSGLRADAALFYDDPTSAGDALRSLLQAGDAVLFKGSRGTQVEKALERYLE